MAYKAEFHEDKYIILKKEYVESLLTDEEQQVLQDVIAALHKKQKEHNIQTDSKYYVCNRDESYARDVIKIILEGEYSKEHPE